jgi:hypothetical protein
MNLKKITLATLLAFAGMTLVPTIASAAPRRGHQECHWHHHKICHWVR